MNPTRRKFFKGAGLVGAFAGGLMTPVVVKVVEEKVAAAPLATVDPSLAPPTCATSIQLLGCYGEPKPQPKLQSHVDGSDSVYLVDSESHTTHSVGMAVGKDNRLWIKVGDEWKRVALES